MAARQVGVAVDGGTEVWQTDATWAAIFAGAVADHFEADRQHLRHLGEAAFAVTEAAGVAVVENHCGAAEILTVDYAAQVAAVAHGHKRKGNHRQIAKTDDAFAGAQTVRFHLLTDDVV